MDLLELAIRMHFVVIKSLLVDSLIAPGGQKLPKPTNAPIAGVMDIQQSLLGSWYKWLTTITSPSAWTKMEQ